MLIIIISVLLYIIISITEYNYCTLYFLILEYAFRSDQ